MAKQMIFLWGFMGAGKSKLGKRLANKLNLHFIDLDTYIEKHQNATISQLFSSHGETNFRQIETACLDEIIQQQQPVLLSCGGGTPCFNQNKTTMNLHGLTIYLQVEQNVLVNRLWQAKAHRPLIANMQTKLELEQYIHQALLERNSYYKTARFTFDNTYPKGNMEQLVETIKLLLEEE